MRVKIIRAVVTDSKGKQIIKPNNEVIEMKEIEEYRNSLKTEPEAKVLLNYEEIG